MKGFVYVLENPSMPGILKIGKTTRSPEERAKELSNATGVPTPFNIVFIQETDNVDRLERSAHKKLKGYRVNNGREFFKINLAKVVDTLKKLEGVVEKPALATRRVPQSFSDMVEAINHHSGGRFEPETPATETAFDSAEEFLSESYAKTNKLLAEIEARREETAARFEKLRIQNQAPTYTYGEQSANPGIGNIIDAILFAGSFAFLVFFVVPRLF
jgi:hypothetical protein